MIKKILITSLLVLMVTFMGAQIVLAEGSAEVPERRGGRRGAGEITAIGDNQFSIRNRQGDEFTLFVDESTIYHRIGEGEATFTDLEVGQWVAISTSRNDQDQWVARRILLLPENLDPSDVQRRYHGEITDIAVNSFTINTVRGDEQTFAVDGNTIFLGEVRSLADLQPGMVAGVGAQVVDGDNLVAKVVRAGWPVIRHAGQVTSVDQPGSSFTIETRQGERLTFQVNEETHYFSKDGLVKSLVDLKEGMVAGVAARQTEEGTYLAIRVGAAEREQLPRFDLRVSGRIIDIQQDSFTIENRQGEEFTFQVTVETHFRSRGGWIESLEDLRTGMRVVVGAEDMMEEEYVAQGVLVVTARFP